jgi:hypothetical protein
MTIVFVSDFKLIERPYEAVSRQVFGHFDPVASLALQAAKEQGDRLRDKVGLRGMPSIIAPGAGLRSVSPRVRRGTTLVEFFWLPGNEEAVVSALDGDVTFSAFGLESTEALIHARCEVSSDFSSGSRLDSSVAERMAQIALRAFLLSLCSQLNDLSSPGGSGSSLRGSERSPGGAGSPGRSGSSGRSGASGWPGASPPAA